MKLQYWQNNKHIHVDDGTFCFIYLFSLEVGKHNHIGFWCGCVWLRLKNR